MSEVRLLVREMKQEWSGTIHASCADRAIAALSADPTNLDELEAAVERFELRPSAGGKYFSNLRPGTCDEPYDAGLVVIDLIARLVVVDSTYSSPSPTGAIECRDHQGKEYRLSYDLAEDWHFSRDGMDWQGLAEARRRERLSEEPLDTRAVFYGRPMIEFVARETFASFARREEIEAAAGEQWAGEVKQRRSIVKEVDSEPLNEATTSTDAWPGSARYESPFYDTLKDIHSAWLLTPRDDLRGSSPREVTFRDRDHISSDLESRCQQWSLGDECPPGLSTEAHAFRYAAFGIHELVEYYELVRELLWSCWERLEALSQSSDTAQRPDSMTSGDFLTNEVPRLEQVRDRWLDTPDQELHGRTPRAVIDRERARLPEGLSGDEAMIDPDCPCCQMMADSGPTFWHLDGCNMDQDFAFDLYYQTREEWEAEQQAWEEQSRKFDAQWAERERLGVASRDSSGDNDVWSRNFLVNDAQDVPLGVRVFGIGCRLAELIAVLREDADRQSTPAAVQDQIDRLNRDFGNLRDVLQSSDAHLAGALIEPVIDHMVGTLASLATDREKLTAGCDSLIDQLRRLLDPPSDEGPTWNVSGDDLPF